MSRARTILVAVATAALLSGGLPTAEAGPGQQERPARPLDWSRTSDPVALRPSTFVRDIACPPFGATCVAVGERRDEAGSRRAVVQRWDGSAWTAEAPPGGKNLVKVSCSTAEDCVGLEEPQFAGGRGRRLAVRSSAGWRWVGFDVRDESVEVTSVSCASSAWCLLTGADREVATFDGTTVRWLRRTPMWVGALACSSAAYCAATAETAVLEWDGTRWSVESLDAAAFLTDIDCWAERQCLATGASDDGTTSTYVRSAQGSWAPAGALADRPVDGALGQTGMDCDSTGTCHVLRQAGRPRAPELRLSSWTAGTWSSQTLPEPDGIPVGLGCHPGDCAVVSVAATSYGEPTHSSALHGAAGRWVRREMVNPLGLLPGTAPHEATCPSRDWCLVLGVSTETGPTFGRTPLEPYLVSGDDARWEELPAALPDQRDLDCSRPGECVIVGSDGKKPRSALLRDGRWRVLPPVSAPWMAGGAITGVGCAKARCTYSGFYRARGDAGTGIFVAWRAAGTWRVQRFGPLFGGEGRFTGRPSMDCPTTSRCLVVTSMRLSGEKQPTSFEASLVGGRWRWSRLGRGFSLYEVDCADARQCVAGGEAGKAGLVMSRSGVGEWRRVGIRARNAEFYSVSCPASTTCHVGGERSPIQLLTRTPRGWQARGSGPRGMTDVACSGPRACLAFNGGTTWVGR